MEVSQQILPCRPWHTLVLMGSGDPDEHPWVDTGRHSGSLPSGICLIFFSSICILQEQTI
eukprot:3393133-Amphidinium_carterae.1